MSRAKHSIRTDEHVVGFGDRTIGALGPLASVFTLAWLASHRDRLRTLIVGGHRLSVLVIWDSAGRKHATRSEDDIRAVYQLTYGSPWPEEADGGS